MLKKLSAVFCSLAALLLSAEPIELQQELKLDTAVKGSTSIQLDIPPVQLPPGKSAVLKFNARIVTPNYAGWGNLLQIVLNNKVLDNTTANGEQRILFRSSKIKTSKAKTPTLPWFGKNRNNTALIVFYAPEKASELAPQILSDRAAGFDYTIRIDDLLRSGQPNKLKFNYLLQKRHVQNRNLQLVLRNITIDFIDQATPQADSQPVIVNGEIMLRSRLALDAPASGTTDIKIDFPAVQVPRGKVPVLAFNARIATPSMGGWNNYLKLKLNNKRIDRENPDGEYRLLRRGIYMQNSLPKEVNRDWWRSKKGDQALLMFFAPESATELEKRVTGNRECRYDYEIDISDLVNRLEIGADDRIESNENNSLQLSYSLMRRYVQGKNIPLIIKDLRIKFLDKSEVEKVRPQPQATVKRNAQKPVASLSGNGAVLEVAADGTLQLQLAGETVFMDSFFSYPAKPMMKYNAFGHNPSGNAAAWQVNISKEAQSLYLTARSGAFEIRRKITFDGRRFNFLDQLKNISQANSALAFFDRFSGNDLKRNSVKLAGQADVRGTVDFFGASNPTVFLPGKKSAWGVVYEDTVSRAQLQLRSQAALYEAGSVGCGAKPNDTIEREFAIYPLAGGDYFDFINQVRRDWGINKFTIPGTLAFSPRGQQPDKPNKLAVIKPWFEFCYYGNNSDLDGALMSRQEFTAKAQKQLKQLRSKRADVRVFASIENNLVPFDCRQYDWARQIRQKGVKEARNAEGIRYGQFLSKELTEKLDAVTPLKDSIIRSADGRAMIDNMYPSTPVINLMVQPELGNSRYKQMIEQIDFLMDKVGVDSIYIDQFQPYTIGGFSENRWDGRTVELAKDGSIQRYRYSYALTGATARAAIIKHITDKGGLVLTNGQSMSKEEQGLFRLAFQEMENDSVNPMLFIDECPPEFRWQSVSHLGCPVALGIRPRKYLDVSVRPNRAAEALTKGVITALRNGLLYYVYIYDIHTDGQSDSGSFDMFERMFPFTPVELNAGYLIGKERIITAVSKNFTVGGSQKPRCTHYNKRGIPAPAEFAVTGQPGAWQVEVKLNDWNEIAIIEINQ